MRGIRARRYRPKEGDQLSSSNEQAVVVHMPSVELPRKVIIPSPITVEGIRPGKDSIEVSAMALDVSEVLGGDKEPFPNFNPVEVDPEVEKQRKIIKRETEEGIRPQTEQLESEGGPPIRER